MGTIVRLDYSQEGALRMGRHGLRKLEMAMDEATAQIDILYHEIEDRVVMMRELMDKRTQAMKHIEIMKQMIASVELEQLEIKE